ncbi:MAG TPA: DUF1501 domain-containing protein [Pirellulaceae bacterium]|nr:DUF1501 domain-containing protein [Pirellulaceae bacterium]
MLRIVRSECREQVWSRRTLLEAAGAGLFGLTLPKLFAAQSQAADSVPPIKTHTPRAKSVIFLCLFGGPSQLETFDLKPNAPEKIRGPFKPTACKTLGLLISEELSRLAAISDKFCVIRSMTHSYNDHSTAGHYIQTGHPWHIPIGGGFNATPRDWPSIGSVVEYIRQRGGIDAREGLPAYVVTPNFLGCLEEYSTQLIRPGEYAGWLGRGYDPLTTQISKRDKKDNPYFRDCTDEELNYQIQGLKLPAELTLERLDKRRTLLAQFDDQVKAKAQTRSIEALDKLSQRAWSLATSPATRQALDIRSEPAELRDKYGRNLFGQSVLLARRLVEAGVKYVTVHYDAVDGYSWDSHVHSNDVKKFLLPSLDKALSSLITDLDERGLLDETLVVCLGEMGRTPSANATWGRGHWSTLFPAVVAGGGIRGGIVYGGSDKDAAYPIDYPVKPEDLAATIYHALGIDHQLQVPDATGRPVYVVDGGRPVMELFG